ncbi:MAG: hypothetical protein D6744_08840 [Planctomycetota bacterium]|nr:MAG: hypothetical protein D6744_08840 [Planctomycetota bacterium]
MNLRIWTLGILVAAGAPLVGCGDAQDERTRFNAVLDGAVAPVSAGSIDTGILKDQSTYQPQDVEPLNILGAALGSAGGDGASLPKIDEPPEAAAVRALYAKSIDGILEGNIDDMMDAYVDEQVAALRDSDFVDNAYVLVESIDALWSSLSEKLDDADRGAVESSARLVPLLRDFFVRSATITLIDDDAASITYTAEGIQSTGEALKPAFLEVLEPLLANLPADQLPPGPDGEPLSAEKMYDESLAEMVAAVRMSADDEGIPVRRQGDSWRLDLGYTFTEDDADALNTFLLVVIDAVDALNQQIEAAEKLDSATLNQILGNWSMQSGMQVLGASAAVQPLLQKLAGGPQASGDAAPASGGQEVSFADDVLPLLTERCFGCHNPNGRAATGRRPIPLDLSPEKAYAQLVGATSTLDSSLTLVTPGDPAASFLYNKLAEQEPLAGRRMPLNDDPLTDEELKKIADWIAAGAPDN